MDRKYRAARTLEPDTSNPVTSSRAFGGVARNVAENLARLAVPTALASLVGDDEKGRAILADAKRLGIDTSLSGVEASHRTAEYVAVLEPDGRLAFGLADMAIFDTFDRAFLDGIRPAIAKAQWVFADCNLPATILAELLHRPREGGFHLAVDPVSRAKAVRLPKDLAGVDLLFLNESEAQVLSSGSDAEQAARRLRDTGVGAVIVTRGAAGAILCDAAGIRAVPACPGDVVDVTGAGDAMLAAWVAAWLHGADPVEAAHEGHRAAAATIQSPHTVRPDLAEAMAVLPPPTPRENC